jgi:23S rRNA (pseudouridine1915-N3)-methyltransferase
VKLRLLLVGKPRDPEAGRLYDRYAGRIESLGVRCESAWVPEVRAGGKFSDDHVRRREARALAERLERDGGKVIALDRRGRMLDSRALAARLEGWTTPRGTFVIGGPLGLDGAFLGDADARWSLSALTLPHELARVVVAEQLYRALTLLRGFPYHK